VPVNVDNNTLQNEAIIMTNRPQKSQCINRLSGLMLLVCLTLSVSGCNWTDLVTVSSTGEQGNSVSARAAASANGRYVAFHSPSSNLVANDINATYDIFVHDTLDGATTRVSVNSAEVQGNSGSYEPSISADGRYVAFQSDATNLVAGDTNNTRDIFVRDRVAGTTTLVSVSSAEAQANSDSNNPSISGDGRYVAFHSTASNLVTGDTNATYDIFVRDRVAGTTTRVSVGSGGVQGINGESVNPSISSDGRYVAFQSYATNLVAGDTNSVTDVFVRDRVARTTTRVSVNSAEAQGNSDSYYPSISGDGRYVALHSYATNLVAGDTNNINDVFVRDTVAGTTTRVSVNSAEVQGNSLSWFPSISGDGRYVAFYSSASNLVSGDANGTSDVFVRDMVAGTTSRVSLDKFGLEGDSFSQFPSISANGRYVAFETGATNLVPNDLNGQRDIAVRAIPEVTVASVIPNHLPIRFTTSVTISGTNFLPGATPLLIGATFSNAVIVDESTITADITVKADTAVGAQDVLVALPGSGPGVLNGALGTCTNCATFVATPPGCS
jgi:hypothetical protein